MAYDLRSMACGPWPVAHGPRPTAHGRSWPLALAPYLWAAYPPTNLLGSWATCVRACRHTHAWACERTVQHYWPTGLRRTMCRYNNRSGGTHTYINTTLDPSHHMSRARASSPLTIFSKHGSHSHMRPYPHISGMPSSCPRACKPSQPRKHEISADRRASGHVCRHAQGRLQTHLDCVRGQVRATANAGMCTGICTGTCIDV